MSAEYQVVANNASAPFTLKIHRGDGMALLAMNWKKGEPPKNFAGFAIEYREPRGDRFYVLKNRLGFPGTRRDDPNALSTLRAPIQKFRWIHFPRNANLPGTFTYRVTPVFMNDENELSYGIPQEAGIELRRETYPGQLNIAYTRGFVSSQKFVERYKDVTNLLPDKAQSGLTFRPTHSSADEALSWMGFEAREAILDVLDKAIAAKDAKIRVIAYDLNEPEVVDRLKKLGSRLRIIIDNDGAHGRRGSAENQAAKLLSDAKASVKRQHVGKLQHNKTIAVDGPRVQLAVCGSTNFSWRAFYVQANNAIVVKGRSAVQPFLEAFDDYWNNGTVKVFGKTSAAQWTDLGLKGINAKVSFSPHAKDNALLQSIADDVRTKTTSCLFYSLAFLSQTSGVIKDAIAQVTNSPEIFVYGISDKKVGGIALQKPDGNLAPVYAAALTKNLPEPFKSEPTGGAGTRMHHKFLVIDFDKPTARVYAGSYNFSPTADTKNGENLLFLRDRRIATSYTVEALSLFDHYHFRVVQQDARKGKRKLELALPPRKRGEEPWWREDYTDARKIHDRKLFA